MMKKLIIASSLSLAAMASIPDSFAGNGAGSAKNLAPNGHKVSAKTAGKEVLAITSSAAAGFAIGGPAGMIIGALGGVYVGEKIEKADAAEYTEIELAETKMQIAELQTQLMRADTQVGELAELAMDKLEFQVLFHTGADQLTDRGRARVVALAKFLQEYPQLAIRLSGHADPRGTEEYNNVLSEHRALSVQNTLATLGVDSLRIKVAAHGSDKSTALKGDYEAYAMERRVDIEIFRPQLEMTLVQAH